MRASLAFVLVLAACGSRSGRISDGGGRGSGSGTSTSDGSGTGVGTGSGTGSVADAGETTQVQVDENHPRIYLPRHRDRLKESLKKSGGKRFREMVDDQMAGRQNVYAFQAWYAAILGQVTGKASYCEYAVAQIEKEVAAEEKRIGAGERAEVSGDSYLYVGERIGDLMLTYDWCHGQTSPEQRTRWLAYAAQAVYNVWNPTKARWGDQEHAWSGWAIDDPSNNYYYSFLRATMLFGLGASGEHADAEGWVTFFRDKKIAGELVPIFKDQLEGGGSREGTGYGIAMMGLYGLYDFWEGSTGERIADLTPHARGSLLHFLHAIVPTRDRKAPIGDHARDSTAALFDFDRQYLITLAHLYPDDPLVKATSDLLARSSVPKMEQPYDLVYDFLYPLPEVKGSPLSELGRAFYGKGTGNVFARSSWDKDATWIGFMAGPLTQSHAHRDQGSLLLYKQGWLVEDGLIHSHSGIRQEEEMHSLVRLDGLTQKHDTTSKVLALHSGPGWFHVAADLAPAYGKGAVALDQREIVFLEPDVVIVFDRVKTKKDVAQIWQLVVPAKPTTDDTGATVRGDKHDLRIDRIAPASAKVSVVALKDEDKDLSGGYRLEARVAGGERQHLHVLSVGKAVKAVAASDADGRTGVAITLADGRTATVRFDVAGVDGTLEISGKKKVSATLDKGVDALPEWSGEPPR